jgi:hypothetical protein
VNANVRDIEASFDEKMDALVQQLADIRSESDELKGRVTHLEGKQAAIDRDNHTIYFGNLAIQYKDKPRKHTSRDRHTPESSTASPPKRKHLSSTAKKLAEKEFPGVSLMSTIFSPHHSSTDYLG